MPTDKRQRQKERAEAARAARAAEMAHAKRRRNIILALVGLVAVFAFAFLYSTLTGDDDSTEVQTPGETDEGETDDDAAPPPSTIEVGEPVEPECPPEDGAEERQTQFTESPPSCLDEDATYQAVFETDAGDITVDLDTETTPETVNNFVFLARHGYYDGTAMFRSNTGIEIIQGGSPHTQDGADPGPGYSLADEGDGFETDGNGQLTGPYTYEPGQLVMARRGVPDGAGAQYFFTTGPGASGLDQNGSYVVFGSVAEGMDVLEAIMATHEDAPNAPVPGEGAPDPKPIVNTVRIIQS